MLLSCAAQRPLTMMLRHGLPRLGAAVTKHKRRRAAPPNVSLQRCFGRNHLRGTEFPQILQQCLQSPNSSMHRHCGNAMHFSSYGFQEDEDSFTSSSTTATLIQETLQDEIRDANARYAQRIVVCEDATVAGWGVTAACDYAPGSVLFVGRSSSNSATAAPDAHTIQVQRNRHVRMDLPARFLNHACGSGANVGVRRRAKGRTSYCSVTSNNTTMHQMDKKSMFNDEQGTIVYEFVAKCNIANGEKLCYDYETTEWRLQSHFQCSCGSPDCRGTIVGFGLALARDGQQYPLLEQKYRPWIAPHLWEMMGIELKKYNGADSVAEI